MVRSRSDRTEQIRRFETEAEVLVAYQLDLLAQIEYQLRSVQKTMRQIEKLRSSQHRVGPELSNGQRGETLEKLHTELDALEGELQTQREMCHDMHGTIDKMQDLLKAFRKLSRPTASTDAGSESATE